MTQTTPQALPQLAVGIFLSEAGIELPYFSTFPLLEAQNGRKLLVGYFQSVIDIARQAGTGVVLETLTWRANADWGTRVGYSDVQLDAVNHDAVQLLVDLRLQNPDVPVVISGNLGPHGDGYVVGDAMSADQAASYHRAQVRALAAAGADLVTVMTLTNSPEAIGIAKAARRESIPAVVSFTVETDGRLPSGQPLADAIRAVDEATDGYVAYYMVNCAHPDHFAKLLSGPGPWERIRGIGANASRKSHAELDDAQELDRGNEAELAQAYDRLRGMLPQLAVVGGCCSTDLSHLQSISDVIHGHAVADEQAKGKVA